MHPKMMIALANEVQRDRESEREATRVLSAAARRAEGLDGSYSTSRVARRLLGGISLRPRLS